MVLDLPEHPQKYGNGQVGIPEEGIQVLSHGVQPARFRLSVKGEEDWEFPVPPDAKKARHRSPLD